MKTTTNQQLTTTISTLINQIKEENLAYKSQVEVLRKQVDQWRIRAERDFLTGCLRREAFLNLIETRSQFGHLESDMTVVVVDIDHFKLVNDKHGHHVGDLALRHTAQILQQSLPKGGLLSRMGGEEFCMVIPGSLETNRRMIEGIRQKLANNPCPLDDSFANGAKLFITASFGACGWDSSTPILKPMIAADALLYDAKNSGRNCVCFADSHKFRKLQSPLKAA